jgi:hypothetical protein
MTIKRTVAFTAMLLVVVTANIFLSAEPAVAQLQNVTAFAQDWDVIVPNDSTTFTRQPRAMIANVSGTLAAIPWGDDGSSCKSTTVVAGAVYPMSPRLICDSGTDATSVTLLY